MSEPRESVGGGDAWHWSQVDDAGLVFRCQGEPALAPPLCGGRAKRWRALLDGPRLSREEEYPQAMAQGLQHSVDACAKYAMLRLRRARQEACRLVPVEADAARLTIQRLGRAGYVRQLLKMVALLRSKTRVIQRAVRCFQARKQAQRYRQQKWEEGLHRAAVVLQCFARRFVVAENTVRQARAVRALEESVLAVEERRIVRDAAVSCLQRGLRGAVHRAVMRKLHLRKLIFVGGTLTRFGLQRVAVMEVQRRADKYALVLQCAWRRHFARRLVSWLRRTAARDRGVREAAELKTYAAVRLQAAFRRVLAAACAQRRRRSRDVHDAVARAAERRIVSTVRVQRWWRRLRALRIVTLRRAQFLAERRGVLDRQMDLLRSLFHDAKESSAAHGSLHAIHTSTCSGKHLPSDPGLATTGHLFTPSPSKSDASSDSEVTFDAANDDDGCPPGRVPPALYAQFAPGASSKRYPGLPADPADTPTVASFSRIYAAVAAGVVRALGVAVAVVVPRSRPTQRLPGDPVGYCFAAFPPSPGATLPGDPPARGFEARPRAEAPGDWIPKALPGEVVKGKYVLPGFLTSTGDLRYGTSALFGERNDGCAASVGSLSSPPLSPGSEERAVSRPVSPEAASPDAASASLLRMSFGASRESMSVRSASQHTRLHHMGGTSTSPCAVPRRFRVLHAAAAATAGALVAGVAAHLEAAARRWERLTRPIRLVKNPAARMSLGSAHKGFLKTLHAVGHPENKALEIRLRHLGGQTRRRDDAEAQEAEVRRSARPRTNTSRSTSPTASPQKALSPAADTRASHLRRMYVQGVLQCRGRLMDIGESEGVYAAEPRGGAPHTAFSQPTPQLSPGDGTGAHDSSSPSPAAATPTPCGPPKGCVPGKRKRQHSARGGVGLTPYGRAEAKAKPKKKTPARTGLQQRPPHATVGAHWVPPGGDAPPRADPVFVDTADRSGAAGDTREDSIAATVKALLHEAVAERRTQKKTRKRKDAAAPTMVLYKASAPPPAPETSPPDAAESPARGTQAFGSAVRAARTRRLHAW